MARPTKGRLFQRGKGKNWYLQYYVNGKQVVVALRNDDGTRVANKEEAEAARDRELLPLRLQTVADRRRAVAEALETVESKAARADREAAAARKAAEESKANAARRKETALANGWQVFMECPGRPRSCRGTPDEIGTVRGYKNYYNLLVKWLKTNRPKIASLGEIDAATAGAMMDDAARAGNKASTYNRKIGFYRLFFEVLKKAGKVENNPFADLELLPMETNSRRPLSPEEVRRLLDNAPDRETRILFSIGYFAGMRLGDAATLRWDEIDLDRGIIERLPRKIASRARDKNAARVKIGISGYLLGLLMETPPADRVGLVLPAWAALYETAGGRYTINKKIMRHFRRCGIEPHEPGTGTPAERDAAGRIVKPAVRAVVRYSFHALRHSFVSHCAEAGVPLAVVQRAAGHATAGMTMSYFKVSDAAARKYAAALALPGPSDGAADREVIANRAKLKELADTAPAEAVAAAVQMLEMEGKP